MNKLKIGIVGCGAIGSEIARHAVGNLQEKIALEALYDIDRKKSEALARTVNKGVVASSLGEIFDRAELVVECASGPAAAEVLKKALEKSRDVMIMSIGGLIDREDLLREARDKNIKVYFPSGALCGIDGLKSAKISKIDKVTLTTRKPPAGLEGAPYLKEKKIDLKAIKKEEVVFEGNAVDAVRGFPKNVNVAALLSLAGVGAERTTVRIVTSPAYKRNIHEIAIEGDFGTITARTENVPDEKNPKTSKLASLSAIATLKAITEGVRMGT